MQPNRLDSADVIVVGAGPAGAVTALLLARAGVRVLVLDRAAFPRPKPCGDCLSFGAGALLERLGLLAAALRAPHARVRAWQIHAPGGASFEAEFGSDALNDCAISIERAVLDEILLNAALEAGARFEQATVRNVIRDAAGRVTGVDTTAGTRTAPLTVGADGLRSVVAARLGARGPRGRLRKLSLTFHGPAEDMVDTGEMHVGDGICAGLAPIDADGRCNLTIVADAARHGRSVAGNAATFARAAVDSLPNLRARVSSRLFETDPLASGPFDCPVQRTVFSGAVLVGDAAGYYDPFTGQGVFQAIASAEILARCILVDDSGLARYDRERTRLLRSARFVQRGIEAVLSRPRIADQAVRRISRARAFAMAIVAVTGDAAPAHALLSPRVLASLVRPAYPEHAA